MKLNFQPVKTSMRAASCGGASISNRGFQRRNLPAGLGASRQRARISQRGIALVITLIMLAVITFMTVTFLVLSQRQRGAVTTSTDQLMSKQASETGLERAKLELLAPMLAFTNDQNYDFLVSTNYINPAGFQNGVLNYTNVNYDYYVNGALGLSDADQKRNLLNLFYNPRPPVFVTNRVTGGNDFRFYLDLNRNGRYDANGYLPVIGDNGGFIHQDGTEGSGLANVASNWFNGDPEWIGVLERPEMPYSSSNQFVYRYAYLVVPASKTLDLNYIHNQAATRTLDPANDGFLRNQGVGTWEINLGAFFSDLNTNAWQGANYLYRQPAFGNSGLGFDDARTLLSYRYNYNYNNLLAANALLANAAALQTDNIDTYSDGTMMLNPSGIDENASGNRDNPALGWAGADNPNHFFTTQDAFDGNKTSLGVTGFTNRLTQVGFNTNSYDRYTFYRMIEQLGTDSAPDPDHLNVNYRNVDNRGNIVAGMETNMLAWAPGEFFTNAANRILLRFTTRWLREDRRGFTNTFGVNQPFGITNIPVLISYTYPTNSGTATNNIHGYTASIHRILQVVANIYDAAGDAGTPDSIPLANKTASTRQLYAPHVYRPIFRKDANNNVFISGFEEVVDAGVMLPRLWGLAPPSPSAPYPVDLSDPADRASLDLVGEAARGIGIEPMAYGVPLVVGAKKGYPNFNKFGVQTTVAVTRRLQFKRLYGQKVNQTNQIHSIEIRNAVGVQAWNSYSNNFPRDLQMIVGGEVFLSVSNETGQIIAAPGGSPLNRTLKIWATTNIPAGTWRAFAEKSPQFSFKIPFLTNAFFLTNSDYVQLGAVGGSFNKASPVVWDTPNTFRVPKLWLNIRSRLRFALVDIDQNRIVDCVNLDSSEPPLDIMTMASTVQNRSFQNNKIDQGLFWQTNRTGGTLDFRVPTEGIINQIRVSSGSPHVDRDIWKDYSPTTPYNDTEMSKFVARMYGTANTAPGDLEFQAPFTPTRRFDYYTKLEANDPLVHYTVADLTDQLNQSEKMQFDKNTNASPITVMLSANPINSRYQPWGGKPLNPAETNPKTQFNTQVKDPLVLSSDDWDFPTNKVPNVGWLGRVHRGTPWQTVYLKSSNVPDNTWWRWSGNTNLWDASHARPVRDRDLFDFFTTAPNENAARGRLSINQEGLAAWSAVLSGVPVLRNENGEVVATNIEPAAVSPEVAQIVNGINNVRLYTNRNGTLVYPNRQFQKLGDILDVPELTENSPFLNTNGLADKFADGISDAVMERIPQQIMSLLSLDHSPRFVIYSYGQSLRPAPNSIVLGGAFSKLCTNYQVTAETATRAVVRVEGSFNPADANEEDPLRRYPPRVITEQFNLLPPD